VKKLNVAGLPKVKETLLRKKTYKLHGCKAMIGKGIMNEFYV
jgi:hypothetical protein